MHPVLAAFLAARERRFPDPDGSVTVVPPFDDGLEAAIAFTAHAIVATALDEAAVRAAGADGYGGAMGADFLRTIAGTGWIGVLDATLAGTGLGGGTLPVRTDLDDHPRVEHARSLRRDVVVYGDERGLVTLATGL